MADKKIGLALGSGSAKGLAHIGVIKVLQENDISVDLVAGSSIGAVIGGMYAAKQDTKEMEQIANETDWQLLLSLIDPSWGQGLIEGEKVKSFIERHLGDVNFEELDIPFSVLATDMRTGDPVVLNEGNVVNAIRASISLPLVFKPVELDGRLLSDGGLSRPVPVDTVQQMGADVVLAVNLFSRKSDTEEDELGLYQVANRSLDLLRYHLSLSNVQQADLVITPEVGEVKWNEFLSNEETIAAGEEAAREMLPEIKELL